MVSFPNSVSLILLVCFASTSLTAQVRDVWQNLSGNYNEITSALDNPQHLFVAGTDGHILRSRNDGGTWTSSGLRTGYVDDVVTGLAAIGGDTLIATSLFIQDAFWRSIDAGDTWTKIETSLRIQGGSRAQAVAPQVAIVGGDNNNPTMITRDGGVTIDTIQKPGFHLFSGGDGILMGVSTTGSSAKIIRSSSFGESWETVTEAATLNGSIRILNGYTVHVKDELHFAITANKEADYLITKDGGLTFDAGTTPGRDIKKIVWLSDTEVISFDESLGAARSTNSGLTWTADIGATPADNRTATHATAHATTAGTLIVATLNELYTQTTGSTDWNLSRGHIDASRVLNFEIADQQTAYLRYNNQNRPEFNPAYATVDGGVNWLPIEGSRLPIHAQSDGVVFASKNTKIERSTDYGATWTEVYPGVGFTPVFEMVSPNNDLLVAVTASGFVLSTDNGINWERQFATGFTHSSGINSIEVIDPSTYVVSSGFDNTFAISITRDTGRTFTSIKPSIIPGGRTTGYVATAGDRIFLTSEFMSADLGQTWERLGQRDTFGSADYDRIFFRTQEEGFYAQLSGNGFAAYTSDAGDRFQEIRTGEFGIANGVRSVGFANDDRSAGFAAGVNMFRYEMDGWPTIQAGLNTTSNNKELNFYSQTIVWPNPASPGEIIQIETSNKQLKDMLLLSPIGKALGLLRVNAQRLTLPQDLPTGLYTLIDQHSGNSSRILITPRS